jgi:hypothetical protein
VDGVCLGAVTGIVSARSAGAAEARGIEAVLLSIHRFEGQLVVIESDANKVVKAIQTKNFPRVYWGSVVRNCVNLLTALPNVSVVWGKRGGNKVAHHLARLDGPLTHPTGVGLLFSSPPPHTHIVSHIKFDMGFG